MPVDKESEARLDEDAPLGDRKNLVHVGTSVLEGQGLVVVCRTGARTEVGSIAASLAEEAGEPPLVMRLARLTRLIAIVVLLAIALLAFGQLLRGSTLTEIFLLSIALAVSAITVALSIATHRITRRNVIVRLLPAVEELGACAIVARGIATGSLLNAARSRKYGRRRACTTW